MEIRCEEGILNSGRRLKKYILENDCKMSVEVISIGATLTKIMVPDAEGKIENVILGWKDLNLYEEHPGNMGAIIGRTAGRIYQGKVTLGGKTFKLPQNTFQNTLHGGKKGFHTKDWEGTMSKTAQECILKLSYLSQDGEEGYPGNLRVTVTYTLNQKNQLAITYEAVTDAETIVNLTNHAYFNLSGNAKRDILDETVYINSKAFYEIDQELIPTGKMLQIEDEPYFDFTKPKMIGQDIGKAHQQLRYAHGYDHIWKLEPPSGQAAVVLYDKLSKRKMTITTTEPAVVMYTMNFADEPYLMDNGEVQKPRYAVCFETQKPAIGYNEVNKEAVILKPHQQYLQQTIFSFSIQNN